MKTGVRFQFRSLPQEVQDEIVVTNELPCHVFVGYGEWPLRFVEDMVEGPKGSLDASTWLEIEITGMERIPKWLDDVECTFEFIETFYGYVENGLRRNGGAVAEVNTFVSTVHEPFEYLVLSTKGQIIGTGCGSSLYREIKQLYRLIRTRKLKKGHIVERWPVQVPEALVTIGAGPTVHDDESE